MTDLHKPIRRRTSTVNQGRALVIELRPGATDTVFIREEGRRNGYSVPLIAVYRLGARLEADAKRAEKKAQRRKPREPPVTARGNPMNLYRIQITIFEDTVTLEVRNDAQEYEPAATIVQTGDREHPVFTATFGRGIGDPMQSEFFGNLCEMATARYLAMRTHILRMKNEASAPGATLSLF